MLAIDEVPLDQFYGDYISHLERAGFKLLIMALVREADAPEFYSDVLRYWRSLHDLTGTSVAFAVAGPDAANQTQEHQSVGRSTSSLFAGKPESLSSLNRWHLEQLAKRPQTDAQSLADANTEQISRLRDCLDLPEDRLPCLHLTLFLPHRRLTAANRTACSRSSPGRASKCPSVLNSSIRSSCRTSRLNLRQRKYRRP